MKLLVLFEITTWSFMTPLPPPQYEVVQSVEDAAIVAYKRSKRTHQVEPDRIEHRLYEVDFAEMTVIQIPLKTIKFDEQPHD